MSAIASLSTSQLPNPLDKSMQQQIVDGVVTLAGSFAAHGDTLSFLGLGINSDQVPNKVELYEATPASGAPAFGAQWVFLPGTNQGNGILEAFNGTTELTASAATYASLGLPAAFVLKFRAWFPLFL